MDVKSFVLLQGFELIYLLTLAFLPFVVALREVTILVLGIASCGSFAALLKYLLKKHVKAEGRVVLISGCDIGFGNSIARRLDLFGFTVIAGCLDVESDGAQLLKSSTTGRMNVISLDVTDEESVLQCMKNVEEITNGKGLWALVNNAGIAGFGNIEFCSLDLYRRVMEVNVFGTIRLTKLCLPAIRAAKGRVINMSGATGLLSPPGQSPLCMSNFATEAFSDSLRLEMEPFGVQVVTIRPGSYFGTTGLLNRSALEKQQVEFEKMKESADVEKTAAYGVNFVDRQFQEITELSKSSAINQLEVVDALEEAVQSVRCRSTYLIDGVNQLLDYRTILARLKPFLPSTIHDRLVSKLYMMSSFTDDAFEKQEDEKVNARTMN